MKIGPSGFGPRVDPCRSLAEGTPTLGTFEFLLRLKMQNNSILIRAVFKFINTDTGNGWWIRYCLIFLEKMIL